MDNEISVSNNENDHNQGKWTDEEHTKFLEGLILYGKNWNSI